MTNIKDKMTTKTKISLIAVLAIAGMLLIPTYSIANAVQPVELSDDLKQTISKLAPERQSHIEKILTLAEQKQMTESESEKQNLEIQIEQELVRLGETEEKTRKINTNENELRILESQIRDLEGIPLIMIMNNGDGLQVALELGTENDGWEETILELSNGLNVQIFYGGSVEYTNYDCTSRTDDCDPLHGGLRIEDSSGDGCTLGLPVEQGAQTGYLTAGHCYSVNDDIYQPEQHWFWDWKIGKINSGDNIDNNDCDCAFITDSNSRTNESKVWLVQGFSSSITGTEVPTNNEVLDISGAANLWFDETVVDNSFTDPNGLKVILLTTGTASFGDSGAPVFDLSDHNLVGTIKGDVNVTIGGQTNTYLAVIPWSSISDGSKGLGVSLL